MPYWLGFTAAVCCVEFAHCAFVVAGVVWQQADGVAILGASVCIIGSLHL